MPKIYCPQTVGDGVQALGDVCCFFPLGAKPESGQSEYESPEVQCITGFCNFWKNYIGMTAAIVCRVRTDFEILVHTCVDKVKNVFKHGEPVLDDILCLLVRNFWLRLSTGLYRLTNTPWREEIGVIRRIHDLSLGRHILTVLVDADLLEQAKSYLLECSFLSEGPCNKRAIPRIRVSQPGAQQL